MNPIGTDHEGGRCRRAVGELHFGAIRRLTDRDALFAECDRAGLLPLDSLGQNREQVAAMKHDVRRAVALGRRRTELDPVPGLAGAPMAYLPRARDDLNAGQRIAQAQRIEDARAVRTELNARPYFFEHGRLLVHIDVDATPQQRQRGGEPANAAADANDLGWCWA